MLKIYENELQIELTSGRFSLRAAVAELRPRMELNISLSSLKPSEALYHHHPLRKGIKS